MLLKIEFAKKLNFYLPIMKNSKFSYKYLVFIVKMKRRRGFRPTSSDRWSKVQWDVKDLIAFIIEEEKMVLVHAIKFIFVH